MVGLRAWGAATLAASVLVGCTLDRDGRAAVEASGGMAQGGGPGVGGSFGGFGPGGSGGVLDLSPGPVENLASSVSGNSITLTWDNPTDADLANVMVVHRAGQEVSFSPVHGMLYSEGTEVMTNQDVIYVNLTETATFTPITPGVAHHFSVWAVDEIGQYSATRRAVDVQNDLGTQVGQIQVALDGTVTVLQQPAHFPLTGNANYNSAMDELEVTLSASNDTGRVVFNLKGLVDNLSEGNAVGAPSMPPNGGTPYVAWGPEGLDVALDQSGTITFDNVTQDPLTFDITLEDAPYLIGHARRQVRNEDKELVLVDAKGGINHLEIPSTPFSTYAVNYRGVAVTPDGKRVFVGAKASPFVTAVDMLTLTNVVGADLTSGGVGTVSGVALSPDGERLFAALSIGVHHWGKIADTQQTDPTSTDVALVELDPVTLTEVQRVDVLTGDTQLRFSRTLAVNHAGTMAAMTVRHPLDSTIDAEIYFIDLEGLMLIDADPATAATIDPVIVSSVRPDQLLFSDDDQQLFVARGFPTTVVDVIDLSDFSLTPFAPAVPMRRSPGIGIFGGRLVIAQDDARRTATGGTPLTSFMLPIGPEMPLDGGLFEGHGVVGLGDRYYVLGDDQAAVFDANTHQRIDVDASTANGTTNLMFRNGLTIAKHFAAITPF